MTVNDILKKVYNNLNYDLDYYYELHHKNPCKIYMSFYLYSYMAKEIIIYENDMLKYHNIPIEIDIKHKGHDIYYCLVNKEFLIKEEELK